MEPLFKEEDFKILSDLGLSHNQAKIYLALLKLGTDSKALTLFKFSGVGRQDVYRVLCELQQLGIVEKLIARPTRFRAIQPKKAVSILLEKKMSAFVTLNEKAELFANRAIDSYVNNFLAVEKDELFLISEKRALIDKCQEEIRKVKISVNSITPSREFAPWIISLYDAFKEAVTKGTKIRWLIEKPDEEELVKIERVLSEIPAINLKYTEIVPRVKFGIYDQKEAILAIFGEGEFAKTPALCSNSRVIVELAKSYFESHWKNALDLKPRK